MTDVTMTASPPKRTALLRLVEAPAFQKLMIGAILLNAVFLGLDTFASVRASMGEFLDLADNVLVTLFAVEIALRIAAHRQSFFRSSWNLFDFAVVAISLAPASGALSVLRLVRVVRVLRLFVAVPQMRSVISALIGAMPGIGAVAGVLGLLLYVSAVLTTNLFGDSFPDRFGSLFRSLFTLFQLTTLDGWSAEIVKPVMDVYPWSVLFFLVYILVATFAVLNLFVAIIVDSMQQLHRRKEEAEGNSEFQLLMEQLTALRGEVQALRAERAARTEG